MPHSASAAASRKRTRALGSSDRSTAEKEDTGASSTGAPGGRPPAQGSLVVLHGGAASCGALIVAPPETGSDLRRQPFRETHRHRVTRGLSYLLTDIRLDGELV